MGSPRTSPLGVGRSAPPQASNSLAVRPVSNPMPGRRIVRPAGGKAERTDPLTGELGDGARDKAKEANRKTVQDAKDGAKAAQHGLRELHTAKDKGQPTRACGPHTLPH